MTRDAAALVTDTIVNDYTPQRDDIVDSICALNQMHGLFISEMLGAILGRTVKEIGNGSNLRHLSQTIAKRHEEKRQKALAANGGVKSNTNILPSPYAIDVCSTNQRYDNFKRNEALKQLVQDSYANQKELWSQNWQDMVSTQTEEPGSILLSMLESIDSSAHDWSNQMKLHAYEKYLTPLRVQLLACAYHYVRADTS